MPMRPRRHVTVDPGPIPRLAAVGALMASGIASPPEASGHAPSRTGNGRIVRMGPSNSVSPTDLESTSMSVSSRRALPPPVSRSAVSSALRSSRARAHVAAPPDDSRLSVTARPPWSTDRASTASRAAPAPAWITTMARIPTKRLIAVSALRPSRERTPWKAMFRTLLTEGPILEGSF